MRPPPSIGGVMGGLLLIGVSAVLLAVLVRKMIGIGA